MRSMMVALTACLAACAPHRATPAAQPQGGPAAESPANDKLGEAKLKNGVPVYFVARASKTVEVHVVWAVGAANDPEGAAGLAGVALGSLDDEIGGRSVDDTKRYLGDLGADLELMLAWK